MSKNHKNKNYALSKLYKILDYNSKKDLHLDNEKYLGSLSQRLNEISGEEIILRKKISKEILEDSIDSLKPKVVIHAREVKKEIEPKKVKIEEKKRIDFGDRDIFEIKKIKIKEPEFIEVKPKAISKEEIIEIKDLKSEEEKLPVWDSVEVHKQKETLEELPEMEPISKEEVKKIEPEPVVEIKVKKEEKKELEDIINFCPECGSKISTTTNICQNCRKEIKVEQAPSFIPVKLVEKEYIPSEWEAIETEKPEDEKIPLIKKEEKINIFKNLKSIDDKTAALLYDKGITTIDLLEKTSKKELTKITGMKKKTAKQIKKELKKKISEIEKEKPVEIKVFEKEEFIEEQLPKDIETEEKTEEWSSPEEFISETSVWEPIEEGLKEEEKETPIFEELPAERIMQEPIIDNEKKVEVFKNIKSIDSKTAVLLFDSGYTTIDALIKASINELREIKGIKRKTIKKIKKEIEETRPIKVKESEEKIKTDNFLKIKEELETTKQELKNLTKDLDKKEKNIKKLQKEIEDKAMDIESKKTELYNKDEEMKHLENQSDQTKQDLEKGKFELNKKQEEIEKLQKELEVKTIDLESKNTELNNKDEEIIKLSNQLEESKLGLDKGGEELNKKKGEIERIKKDLQTKTLELDKKQQAISELQSKLTQTQKELEIKDKDIKIKTFKDINSIDEQTAILLYDNGITTIEALKNTTKKDLTKIKGIKRKIAKKIINELEQKSEEESIQEEKKEVKKRPAEYKSDKKEITKVLKKKEKQRTSQYFSDENDITKDESMQIDKKIADEFSIIVKDEDVFKEVNSINENISKLLIENGISTIDALKNATIKDLTRIKGIKRRVAKQIKKEISNLLKIDEDTELEPSFEREADLSADEEEAEWEYYDEHLISNSIMKEYKGFKYKDYTLYKKEIETKSGKKRIVRFFSKSEPDDAEPIELPKGYLVKKNKKTGLPYLRKKK